jgi:effector-binding domain-containing protein
MVEPVIRHEPERPIISIRERTTIAALPQLFGRCYGELFGWLGRHGRTASGEPFVIYHAVSPAGVDAEVCVPVAEPLVGDGPVVSRVLPPTDIAVLLHVGPYDRLHEAYAALEAWIADHGFHVSDAVREVYLNSPAEVASPAEYRTEIRMPVEPSLVEATS